MALTGSSEPAGAGGRGLFAEQLKEAMMSKNHSRAGTYCCSDTTTGFMILSPGLELNIDAQSIGYQLVILQQHNVSSDQNPCDIPLY